MLEESAIGDLVMDLFKDAKYEDVVVSDTQFREAKKYKVADDSFYVEATYITVVRYSEVKAPLNSVWITAAHAIPSDLTAVNVMQSGPQYNPAFPLAVQAGASGGFANRVPLSYLMPTTVKKNYEAVVDLVLSFRTVSNTTQSVEILHAEVSKHTVLSEVPVVPAEGSFVP